MTEAEAVLILAQWDYCKGKSMRMMIFNPPENPLDILVPGLRKDVEEAAKLMGVKL